MSNDTDQRVSILGSEVVRRTMLGVHPAVSTLWTVTGLTLAGLTFFVIGPTPWMLLIDLVVGVSVAGTTIELNGRRSLAGERLAQLRTWMRHRAGMHVFRNIDDPLYGDPDADPGWEVPTPLGLTEPMDLAGTGLDDMFVLDTRNPGERHRGYYAVIIAIQGLAEGLRGDPAWAVTSRKFGATLAAMAKRGSFIGGFAMLHRSVPADLTPHVSWIQHKIDNLDPTWREQARPAIVSYDQLIAESSPYAEEHRSYAVLIFPKSPAFRAEAGRVARRKNASGAGGIAQVIRDETAKVQDALAGAGMGRVEVYGEQRACAVFRAMLNPSFPLDAHAGARWHNCWPTYIGDAESVQVGHDVTWNTRVGVIAPRSIDPIELGPLWHAPLLTGVDPDIGDDEVPASPTIRTVMVRMDFVDARTARQAAKHDTTVDWARTIANQRKSRIDDGTSDVMATASARRRADLAPGLGHHGVIWSMAVSVTGRTEDDVLRACARVEQAADNSAIQDIDWQDNWHDVAMFTTLPLGRGLAVTKHTKKG